VIGELFRLTAKINIVHAPFQGGGPAIAAAVGGHIPWCSPTFRRSCPSRRRQDALAAVTTPERAEAMPEVPTMREVGYPEVESTNWSGLVVPASTPSAAVARLNAELGQALGNTEIREKLKTYGMSPAPGTPEQFGAFLQSESVRYAKVVRELG